MNAVIIEVTRRADGRCFPSPWPTAAERSRARVLAHALVCRDQLSYRMALEAMRGYGIRRSLGWLSHTLSHYACGHPRCPCAPLEPGPANQPAGQDQPAAAVHQASVGLTGQVISGG